MTATTTAVQAPTAVLVRFSFGDFARAILSGLITSYVMAVFIPQGNSSLPILLPAAAATFAVVRGIGSIFDALIDPLVASLSDRSRNGSGRRVPFMRWAAVPWALSTALIVFTPFDDTSVWNTVWVAIMLPAFYVSGSFYLVPQLALTAELVSDTQRRVWFYTVTTLFFVIGSAVAAATPVVKGALVAQGLSELTAWRLAFALFAFIGLIAALIPALTVDERRYVDYAPSYVPLRRSFVETFRYRDFTVLVLGFLMMWVAFAMFNTSLLYYITMLIGQPESFQTIVMVITIVLGVSSYPLVNRLAARWGKKPLILMACAVYVVIYLSIFAYQVVLSVIPGIVFSILIGVVIAVPISITNILPSAAFADLAQYDTIKTGRNRAGMFFAARNFVNSLSQTIVFLTIPSLISWGSTDGKATVSGVQATALIAAVVVGLALAIYARYDDAKITSEIDAFNATPKDTAV